jgi:hypothetical protein
MDRDDRDIMLHEAMAVVVHTGRARRRGSFWPLAGRRRWLRLEIHVHSCNVHPP